MAKAKGIRVNQLAKELGVPSKIVLDRFKSEGLGDKVPNHMSLLGPGLEATVREWFPSSGGGVATAVEEPPVEEETAPRAKVRPSTRKKSADGEDSQGDTGGESFSGTALADPAHGGPSDLPFTDEEQAQPAHQPPAHVSPAAEHPPLAPDAPEPAAPVAPELPPQAPIAAEAPAVAPHAPAPHAPAGPAGHRHGAPAGPAPRPTIRIGDRAVVRQPVVQAQKLVPAPATVQGPRIIRVEEPDHVPAPRVRRPMSDSPQTGTAQARPQAGRGVRVTVEEETEEGKKAGDKKGAGRTNSTRRRGPDGRRGEAIDKLKEWSERDLLDRDERLKAAGIYVNDLNRHVEKTGLRGTHEKAQSVIERGEPIELEEPITVKTLAAALGVKSNEIISKLMKQGVFANINQALDTPVAQSMALDYGLELTIARETSMEEQLDAEMEARVPAEGALATRPPVVTILGHVDHGKTSLLDKIRNANVAAGEAGGITQHTAAWMVQLGEKRVTFIDTPGHQAFTAMRARGANMTDVVVLVVSAAEGVQPQTVESISHARAAGVPIVVALNKIDRADANPDMVLGQLAKEGLNPVEWGGDTEVVRTSAQTGQGIADLIEILDLQSQIMDLKADPTTTARGMVIESRVDEGLGPVATVLVQDGTLKVGDMVLAGPGYGRIRSLLNDRREHIQEAGPSTPVIVSGLDVMPSAGDKFYIIEDLERARAIAQERQGRARQAQLANRTKVSLTNLNQVLKDAATKEIRLIIKADVQGSVETLAATVTQANTEEVKIRVLHAAAGPITESDVELADASDAVIIGFHVVPDDTARAMAEHRRVEIRLYRVIYEILDDLKKALSGLLEPEIREKYHGRAEIRQVYKFSKVGNIAGCMITDGHIQRGSKIRLIRNGVVVTEDLTIETLRRLKDDVREVKQGFECGIKVAGYDDIKIGDVLEGYVRETIQRTL